MYGGISFGTSKRNYPVPLEPEAPIGTEKLEHACFPQPKPHATLVLVV